MALVRLHFTGLYRYTAEDLLGCSFIKNAKPGKFLELLTSVPDVGDTSGEPPHAQLSHVPSDEYGHSLSAPPCPLSPPPPQ